MASKTAEIVCVLDRSGSMDNIRDDAIGGFNNFIKEQKAQPGKAKVSLILFDDKYEMVYRSKALGKVEKLDERTFVPRGMTAMNDAIGKTIRDFEAEQNSKPKSKRNPVIFVILTDGMENASHEFDTTHIKEMITEKQEEGWEFVFLAANQDAFAKATSYGMKHNHVYNWTATAKGTQVGYCNITNSVNLCRAQINNGEVDVDVKVKKAVK